MADLSPAESSINQEMKMSGTEPEQYKKYAAARIEQIIPLLQKYALGDFSDRFKIPEKEDEFTQLLVGLNLMVEDLEWKDKQLKEAQAATTSARLEKVIPLLQKYAMGDFSDRFKVPEKEDEFTQLMTGLNLMGEDLEWKDKQLKEAQASLVRSEKLAAVGELASKVAHELRNPLGSINTAIYYFNLIELGKDNPDVKDNLGIIRRSVDNCDRIISDLLEFSRTKKPILRREDLNLIIKEILPRLKKRENIRIITELDAALPKIEIDALQAQQLFYNIANNAIQAMEQGGTLTIKTFVKDDFIETSFTDTGCGIPQENYDKIFDALFSTKARGTGLGLSVCRSIIEGHEGKIEFESKIGEGTTFRIMLPIIKRGKL